MKAHKILLEALSRLHWNRFLQWLESEDYSWRVEPLNECLELICGKFKGKVDLTDDIEEINEMQQVEFLLF